MFLVIKKKTWLVLMIFLSFFALIIIGLVGYSTWGWFRGEDTNLKMRIQLIETFNPDIMVYGNLSSSRKPKISFRKLEKIDDENLSQKGTDGLHIIIVYDVDGTLDLSPDELKLIKRYCEENFFDALFIGNKHSEQIIQSGLSLSDVFSFLYCGYQYVDGFPYEYVPERDAWRKIGSWGTISNPYLIYGPWNNEGSFMKNDSPNSVWDSVLGFLLYSLGVR